MDAIESLSPQQRRCLEGVIRGLSGAQIAHEMGLAESTVIGHLNEARRKLKAPNRRLAAYQYGVAAGLIPPNQPPATVAEPPPQEVTGQIQPVDSMPSNDIAPTADRLAEERSTFRNWPVQEAAYGVVRDTPRPSTVLVSIAIIAAVIVILLLALDPLVQSAARLAGSIQAPLR